MSDTGRDRERDLSRSPSPELTNIAVDDEPRHRHPQPDLDHLINTGSPSVPTTAPLDLPKHTNSPSTSSRPPKHANEDTDEDDDEVSMTIHPYAPLLNCPACVPPARLRHPTTLYCGHTVCASHLCDGTSSPHASSSKATSLPKPPLCPLPSCRATPFEHVLAPNIPPESPVRYFPPLSSAPVSTNEDVGFDGKEPNVDVLVGRVMDLVGLMERGHSIAIDPGHRSEDRDDTEGSDEDEAEEEEPPDDGQTHTKRRNVAERTAPVRPRRPRARPKRYPRKRARCDMGRQSLRSASESDMLDFLKELNEVLTCDICSSLLYQPVTTPCQHTFCAKCLQRSLDHGTTCPLCRQALPSYSYFQDHPLNKLVFAILLKAFGSQYADRKIAFEEEEKSGRCKTPIFVYQVSFPGIPTLLHLYEPRYRLMLRRVLEAPRPAFGMVMPPPPPSAQTPVSSVAAEYGHGYGTMLDIRSVQMLPDGRSIVETIGMERFRVMDTGTVDGYLVGRVERVDDVPEEIEEEAELNISSLSAISSKSGPSEKKTAEPSLTSPGRNTYLSTVPEASSKEDMPSSELKSDTQPQSPPPLSSGAERSPPPTTEELVAICHAFVAQLRNGTAPWVVQRLNNAYGPEPKDIASFSFWMAQVLPIEDHEKAKLLVIRSPRARLRLVVHWIEQLNSRW